MSQHFVYFISQQSLKQVKIVSVNNPLVFLNARKFHADLTKIIQKDSTSSQACEDVNKVRCATCFSNHGDSVEERDCFLCIFYYNYLKRISFLPLYMWSCKRH